MMTAKASVNSAVVSAAQLTHDGRLMTADVELALTQVHAPANGAILLTPAIAGQTDTVRLAPVGIYGRTRWYHYQRDGHMLGGTDEKYYRQGEQPATLSYRQSVDYEPWMDSAELLLIEDTYGCCRRLETTDLLAIGSWQEPAVEPYVAQMAFVVPEAETIKTRSIKASAFITFKVNQIVLEPAYMNNPVELGKIQASIDSVKEQPDLTIKHVAIQGFASPEGGYQNNVRLSIGRTEALCSYVEKLYSFAPGMIERGNTPVNWPGLEEWLETNTINDGKAILELVRDQSIADEQRNTLLRQRYPSQYQYLLQNVYPWLRRSDYRIDYVVRSYTDVNEIAAVYATAPGNLSLNEMYLLSRSVEPGSQQFIDIMETAVRIYPESEVANLNAAFAAIQEGNYTRAEQRLQKAGTSPQATYARALVAYQKGYAEDARALLEQAAAAGVAEATAALEGLTWE